MAIYDECSRILYQEIDYRLEGKNADQFRENFKDTAWVKVPAVLWKYSGEQVLTLEYVPGGGRSAARLPALQRLVLPRAAITSARQ